MNVICKPILNGITVYWDAVENAASYTVTLYLNGQAISVRNNPRTELYCPFTGLAGMKDGYKINAVAEDRNGDIIAESERHGCNVIEIASELAALKKDLINRMANLKMTVVHSKSGRSKSYMAGED